MTKVLALVISFAVVLSYAIHAEADMYKWVDDNGVTHFSDTLPDNGQSVDTLKTPDYSAADSDSEPVDPENYPQFDEARDTTTVVLTNSKPKQDESNAVELFTTSWCPYCKHAVAFLRSNNIPYKEYDIEKDRAAARRMKALGSKGSVPFALINGRTVSGFSVESYRYALGLR